MRDLAVLDAPCNLGLAPPEPGAVPGCYKLPWALRDNGFVERIAGRDAGAVVPPRYNASGWRPGDGVLHAHKLADYTVRLAHRLTELLDDGAFPVVLGGDCSILLGSALALRRRGRFGLACVDGPDFRHPGNSDHVARMAGESLAVATGRGQPDLADIDELGPYLRDSDVVLLGMRDDEEFREEVESLFSSVRATAINRDPGGAARETLQRLEKLDGFWVHVDADVLDPSVMPAVDTPEPGGLSHAALTGLLAPLVASPRCLGFQFTIFDPDGDPDARLAAEVTDTLVTVLR